MECTNTQEIKIGVLAFQGAFAEHNFALDKAFRNLPDYGELKDYRLNAVEVRTPSDLEGLHGLILPGGESTTMGLFLQRNNFKDALTQWIQGCGDQKPVVWGTCAGLILLADRLTDTKKGGQITIGGLNITASRNIYGRQCDSFEAPLNLNKGLLHSINSLIQEESTFHGIFIRAPGIHSVDGPEVRVLATLSNQPEKVVAVEENNLMATAFHPELTDDTRWHAYFLIRVLENLKQRHLLTNGENS